MTTFLTPGRCYVIAEIGPNWCVSRNVNDNFEELTRLVNVAHEAGADAVKVQLKSLNGYYSRENLDTPITDPRSPFATRREYVMAREPTAFILKLLSQVCREVGIRWGASPWDQPSVDLLGRFEVPWVKVASASLTDDALLRAVAAIGKPVILSTGMSTMDEVAHAIEVLGTDDLVLLSCTSTYPCDPDEINLRCIDTLRERFGVPVGYSGHETGLSPTFAAAVMGACVVERHITMDRSQWGPDHAASLEPEGLRRLVRDIRLFERARGDGVKRVWASEEAARKRLRRVG